MDLFHGGDVLGLRVRSVSYRPVPLRFVCCPFSVASLCFVLVCSGLMAAIVFLNNSVTGNNYLEVTIVAVSF